MIAPLLLACALGASFELELEPRKPLVLVEAPGGSAIAEAIAAVIERRTKLVLVGPDFDVAGFNACASQGRMPCWTKAARGTTASFVLVAGTQPVSPTAQRASLVLLDLKSAGEILDRGKTDAELELVTNAVRVASGIVLTNDAVELERSLDAMLSEKLAELLTRTGSWGAFATLEIEAPREGLSVWIDGRRAGALKQGLTKISGLSAPGRHHIELVDEAAGGDVQLATEVSLEPGATRRIALDPPLPATAGPGRAITLGAGAGLATIGLALSIFAIAAKPGTASHRLCAGAGCSADAGSGGLLSFADLETRASSFGADRGGPPIAALGLGLFALGGTWALGAAIEGDHDWPYIALAIGLAAGGATFGVMAALD